MDLEVPCLLLLETALTGEVDLSLLLLPPPPPPPPAKVELCVLRWAGRLRAFAGEDVADAFPLFSDREPSWFASGSFLVDEAVAFALPAVVFEVPPPIIRAGEVDLAEEDCPAIEATALGRLLDCIAPVHLAGAVFGVSTE